MQYAADGAGREALGEWALQWVLDGGHMEALLTSGGLAQARTPRSVHFWSSLRSAALLCLALRAAWHCLAPLCSHIDRVPRSQVPPAARKALLDAAARNSDGAARKRGAAAAAEGGVAWPADSCEAGASGGSGKQRRTSALEVVGEDPAEDALLRAAAGAAV